MDVFIIIITCTSDFDNVSYDIARSATFLPPSLSSFGSDKKDSSVELSDLSELERYCTHFV